MRHRKRQVTETIQTEFGSKSWKYTRAHWMSCLVLFRSLTIASVLVFFGYSFPALAKNKLLVFVNGNGDCCAWSMDEVSRYAKSRNFQIMYVAWSNFGHRHHSGVAVDDRLKKRFVTTGLNFLGSLPKGANVYLIGHSWGGDSSIRLASELSARNININLKLLAVIDAVGPGGVRRNLRNHVIRSNVEYFYNRWQKNTPFPIDFGSSGELDCKAKICDQESQNLQRYAGGDAIRRSCKIWEFGCIGRRENPFDFRLGYVHKRTTHQGLPTDDLVQHQLKQIIERLKQPAHEADRGVSYVGDRSTPMDKPERLAAWPGSMGAERRRRWSRGQRAAIVSETDEPGVSVSEVARRYAIAPSQVFCVAEAGRRRCAGGDRRRRTGEL